MHSRKLVFVLPIGLFAAAAIPGEADAAYSGTIIRHVCAVAAMPRKADAALFDFSTACRLDIVDPSCSVNPCTYRYAAISLPVERNGTSTTISTTATFFNGDSTDFPCAQAHVFLSNGNFSASTSSTCVTGNNTAITLPSLTLPADGAISVSLAGQDGHQWRTVKHQWTASGF
jgi:hypothetical protein